VNTYVGINNLLM